jgi:hypothetical protein
MIRGEVGGADHFRETPHRDPQDPDRYRSVLVLVLLLLIRYQIDPVEKGRERVPANKKKCSFEMVGVGGVTG